MNNREKVRILNDNFRQSLSGGRVVATAAIADRPDVTEIMNRVRCFSDFCEDNDSHGEHDFGAFDHAGEKIFWKIDYYDLNLEMGSEDPSNPEVTTRVLSILWASEY